MGNVQSSLVPIMDPYVFFGLTQPCTVDQAKRAYYKKARDYHPDRGGDQQVFSWIHQSYIQILHEIQEQEQREDHIQRRKQYQTTKKKQESQATASESMQKIYDDDQQEVKFQPERFNTIFEQVRSININDKGYGDKEEFDRMMEQMPQQPTLSGNNKEQFADTFLQQKKEWQVQQTKQKSKELAKYRGPEALVSTSFLACEELGSEQIDDFTSPMSSKMNYTDYQGAYTRFHQLEENQDAFERRPKTLESYNAERDRIPFQSSTEEQEAQKMIQMMEEEREQQRIKRVEENDRQATIQHEKAKKFYLQKKK